MKRAYRADPENTEWIAQKDPADLCENHDHHEIEEKEMKLYNQLLLHRLSGIILKLAIVSA